MINRRRFIAISASAAAMRGATAKAATKSRWNGHAFGANVHIELLGGSSMPMAALEAARDTIFRLEKQFSIYDPASALSQLNTFQELNMPPEFSRLMGICDQVHGLTNGHFDPTVQPLFEASRDSTLPLSNQQIVAIQKRTGWHNVVRSGQRISFAQPDMAMTLNGIAQGFASDRVADVLNAYGFEDIIVNIGEHRAGPKPLAMEIQNHAGRVIDHVTIQNASIATSSQLGYRFASGRGHIFSATRPYPTDFWNTVCVVAPSAAVADGISTALALTQDMGLANRLYANNVISKFVGEDRTGKVYRIG